MYPGSAKAGSIYNTAAGGKIHRGVLPVRFPIIPPFPAAMLPLISLTLGLALLCGLNLYLVVFLSSLAVPLGWVDPSLQPLLAGLGHPAITVVALLLFLVEFVFDKIPFADSLSDAVHTVIRPFGAVALSLVLMRGMDLPGPVGAMLLAALAGVIALATHLTKSGIRLLINASPEPFSNILASLAEDLAVALLFLLLIHAPVTGLALSLALLAGTWILLPRLLRAVRTTLFLVWKKITASGNSRLAAGTPLPAALGVEQEMACRRVLETGGDPAPAWAVRCVTGKIQQSPGLRANLFGTLVAPADHPGSLIFLFRSGFRWRAVRLSLAGCTVRQESTRLSQNLVIHRAADGCHVGFRFPCAEAAVVDQLVPDLRRRLGLEAPSLLPGVGVASPPPLPPERATEVGTPPPSLQH